MLVLCQADFAYGLASAGPSNFCQELFLQRAAFLGAGKVQHVQFVGAIRHPVQALKRAYPLAVPDEPSSKLLVSPLITRVVVHDIIPYITPFKDFRL